MAELADLLKRPVEGVCDWAGVVVKFVANRSAHTHAYEQQLRAALAKAKEAGEDASITEFYAEALTPLLISWDLRDGKKLVPISEESLLGLPLPFLEALAVSIREVCSPFDAKPTSSPSGSFA